MSARRWWCVVSSAGVEMGIYEGATAEEALDAMARDAGYDDQAEAALAGGAFDGTVKPLARPLDDAQAILRAAGVRSPVALGEDSIDDALLGCSLVEHRAWLQDAPVAELTEWATDWIEKVVDADDPVLFETMPNWLRESHRKASGLGRYPANGASRYIASRAYAEELVEADEDGYDRIVRDATPADLRNYEVLS